MTNTSVLDLFHRPDVSQRIALVTKSGATTYGETAAAIDRVAAGLWALGVRKGDRVGIYVTNTPQLLQLTFAAWRLGAITAYVDVFHGPATAVVWCNQVGVKCVVVDENHLDAAAPHLADLSPGKPIISTGDQVAVPGVLPWSTLFGGHPPAPAVMVDESDQLLLIRTSGTTARPKGICHTLRNLNARLRSHLPCPQFTPDDVACPMSPMTTVAGLNAVSLPALAVGARIVLLANAYDPVAALEQIVETGGTLVMAGPARLHGLINVTRERPELARTRLRFGMTGGDKLSIPLRKAWDETFRVPLLDGFGISETLGGVLINRLEDKGHAGNVGFPFPDVEVRLVGEDGREVPDGTPGELWVKADFLFTGYLDEPERTREALVDGWFRTGDYLSRDSDGRYHPQGRRDFLIMRGTVNISPLELESVILNDAAVADCMVAGFPHEVLGQEVEAFLVLREPRSLDDVKGRVMNRVGPVMCPSQFWSVPEIPRTGPGKVDRRAAEQLRAQATLLA
jgi:acyl-CoA synthetase (AMP-forming)/AMP-acid ligase II